MFWNLAIVRGVYGLIGTLMSLYVVKFGNFESIAVSTTRESLFLCLSHFGFFVFEWTAQILFDIKFVTFSQALHVHHFIAFAGYFMSIYYETNHYISLLAFVLESSTPFSCLCYCLIKAGMEKTFLWKANQFLLVHIFHVRSVLEMLMLYLLTSNKDEFAKVPPVFYWHSCISVSIVMICLTPLWTYRKTKQLFEPADWNTSDVNNKKQA
jgi:ceroid-lipofuscinosis protein 8